MQMDQLLPESASETAAEIEVLTIIRAACDALRTGKRIDLSKASIQEIERCDARLAELNEHAKRFGKRQPYGKRVKKDAVAA